MLFHVGALLRLKEAGLFGKLLRISSVSGGAITAGALGMNWSRLDTGSTGTEDLREWLVEPIRHLTGQTIDLAAIGWGLFSPVATISDEVVSYYLLKPRPLAV